MAADRLVVPAVPRRAGAVGDERMLDPIDLVSALIETTPTPWDLLGQEHYARIAATAQGLLRYEAQARGALERVRGELVAGDLPTSAATAAIARQAFVVERVHVAIDLIEPYVRVAVAAGAIDVDALRLDNHHLPTGRTTTQ